MWTCPLCQQPFAKTNQPHSCNERTVDDFLKGKSSHAVELFNNFIDEYKKLADIKIHPTKSMIGIAAKTRIAYIAKIGRDFVDVVFPFAAPYNDNLCFHKIAKVPGSNQYNHHFRLLSKEDINEEVKGFMKLAYELDQ